MHFEDVHQWGSVPDPDPAKRNSKGYIKKLYYSDSDDEKYTIPFTTKTKKGKVTKITYNMTFVACVFIQRDNRASLFLIVPCNDSRTLRISMSMDAQCAFIEPIIHVI